MSLRLDWVSYEAAKVAVERWHYSRQLPKGRQNYIGVWENEVFIGVVIFGKSAGASVGASIGLDQWSCCELTRIALTKHQATVTRIVSIALKILQKKNHGLRAVVSYADANQDHHGGIYQAGNWRFIGTGGQATEWFWRGKWRSDMRFAEAWKGKDKSSLPKRQRKPKFKYVYFFDKELEEKWKPHFKPYPKRAGSKANVAPADQAGEGGATPTPALHSSDPGADSQVTTEESLNAAG